MTANEPDGRGAELPQSKPPYIRGVKGTFWFFVILLTGPIIGWAFDILDLLVFIYIGLAAVAALLNFLD